MKRIGKLMEGMMRAGSKPGTGRAPAAALKPASIVQDPTPGATPRPSPISEVKPSPWSEEAIRARAHQIWLARGGGDGDDLADWIQAEQELSTRPRTA